ncbi:hypothetical protein [Shewanella nanhaiensis]|uniref:Lipoprotein n=1 Tax=Shewanella nanhaiensis TaxID=2864872 RepID=A0ABS7E1V7_9GAMM|nr:hypothetical protein [Shewanella nanhaiensis]MBW8183151.1 hypothetical protein [Shewanella nanhaiensis]
MFKHKIELFLISSLLLSGCGGSDSPAEEVEPPVVPPAPTPTEFEHKIEGTIAYLGAVAGADICVDLDMNKRCDEADPQSSSETDGSYQIDWSSSTENPAYYLIANWTDTQTSTLAAPTPLSSQFKANALNLSSSKTDADAAQRQTLNAVINNGIGQLFSLQDHSGAINALTHIEFQRYEMMLEQALSSSDILLKKQELALILNSLYPHSGSNVYQVSTEQSEAAGFVDTQRLHSHLTALIDDNLTAILGIDELFSSSKAALITLAEESGLSLEEYLNSDPIDVRFLVNNTLIAQGYIDTPFDEKIMSEVDWQVLQTNIMNDNLTPNKFTLAPVHLNSFFSLDYGNPDLTLLGSINNNQIYGSIADSSSVQETPLECWNGPLEKWINADRDDQGYQPIALEFNNNTLTTHYDGTDVPIHFSIEKYHRDSEQWQAIISATPEEFKLDQLIWPEYIYRYHIEQTQDVMCRVETDFLTWDMPLHNDPQLLTTADIARLFWPAFYPDEVAIDEENQRLSVELTLGTISTFEWSLQTSPNDLSLIHVLEVDVPQELDANILPDDYLIEGDKIIEVDINKANSFDDMNDYLLLTYDGEEESFSQRIYAHIISLLPSR